jgi:hypothetical protein
VSEATSCRPKVRFLKTDFIFKTLHSYNTIVLRRKDCLHRVWNKVGGCSFRHGNIPSDSIKGKQFLDQLSDYRFLKEDSVLWSLLFSFNS